MMIQQYAYGRRRPFGYFGDDTTTTDPAAVDPSQYVDNPTSVTDPTTGNQSAGAPGTDDPTSPDYNAPDTSSDTPSSDTPTVIQNLPTSIPITSYTPSSGSSSVVTSQITPVPVVKSGISTPLLLGAAAVGLGLIVLVMSSSKKAKYTENALHRSAA